MKKKNPQIKVKILKVSKELFLEKGFDSTSMRDIANRSDCSLSNIYTYFGGKFDLFMEVFEYELQFFDVFLKFFIVEDVFDLNLEFDIDIAFKFIYKKRKTLKILFFYFNKESLIEYFFEKMKICRCLSCDKCLYFKKNLYQEIEKTLKIIVDIICDTELEEKEFVNAFTNLQIFRKQGWNAVFRQ
ncbi:MAG: TetR/AcrR family transcriptional regulator [Candidatus Muirbacterium halophilum]|nr:TetR/AcrR family transcriptional regulator [Candidatus Muirbacterium halophilum]MCK9475891.1 TetR/AcrR family transcriptional regulator [Candidatus Muirbacterium halophilum]